MPIELKITVDDPSELAAIVASLHGQMSPGSDVPVDVAEDSQPKKTRARKAKAEKVEADEPVAEESKPEPEKAESAAEDPKSDEPPSVDDLRSALAAAINKLPGGQDEVRDIMSKFVPDGEKVILPNVPEDKRAELIHMLNIKMEQA